MRQQNAVFQELNLEMSPDKRHGSAVDRSTQKRLTLNYPYSIYFIELYIPCYSSYLAEMS